MMLTKIFRVQTKYLASMMICFWMITHLSYSQNQSTTYLDENTRYGQLTNGFQYYIKNIPDSDAKISTSLIVKAGDNNQTKEQYGMAHFLEHMPFQRTKNFESIISNTELLNLLEMRLNGVTGAKHTEYSFNFPSHNKLALDTSLLFFKDIASGGIRFNKKDIDGERGAFYEEHLFRGAGKTYNLLKIANTFSNTYKGLKKPSEYRDYIYNFKIKNLKDFYKEWYRPDLMALTVVGHIKNLDQLENQIQTRFNSLIKNKSKIHLTDTKQDYFDRAPQFMILNDSINQTHQLETYTSFYFYIRDTQEKYENSIIKNELLENMMYDLINKSLHKSLLAYHISYNFNIQPSIDIPYTHLIKVKTEEKDSKQSIQKAFSILNRRFESGFTKDEFENSKEKYINRLKKKDSTNTFYWLHKFKRHFIEDIEFSDLSLNVQISFLKELTLEEFNTFVRRNLQKQPEDIAVINPSKDKFPFSEAQIRRWVQESPTDSINISSKNQDLRITDQIKQEDLLPQPEYQYEDLNDFGTEKIILKNGIKLIIKAYQPEKGRYQDDIMLHGFSPNGVSSFSEENFHSVIFASDIVRHSGIGKLDKFDLKKQLKDTSIPYGFIPYISAHESGIKGNFKLKDLELALQLVYLYMSAPRYDKSAYLDWKKEEKKKFLKKTDTNPKSDFYYHINKLTENRLFKPQGTYRYLGVDETDLDIAYKAYSKLMQNTQDFTFIITGNFKKDNILPLVNKYLSAIPNNKKAIHKANVGANTYLKEKPLEIVYTPKQAIQNVHLFYKYTRETGSALSLKDEVILEIIEKLVHNRLRELRFKGKRAIYLSAARKQINRANKTNSINLILSCSQEDLSKIKNDLKKITHHLKTQKINESLFKSIINSHVIPKYSQKKRNQNKSTQAALYEHYRYHIPIVEQKQVDKIIKSINTDDILDMCQLYFKDENLVKFFAKNDYSEI
ncbi:M16 family metallopeptidase [Psychroflexus sp. S27]|uniref:M16 family metallopeptidase n=1 Tax=Psychroflexus sp. S27 TaxID=1982757 RepID=UPI0018644BB9|nr:insulinase family protein [Psychroflexus sp. S27]